MTTLYADLGSLSSGTLVPHALAYNLAVTLESLIRRDTDEGRREETRKALDGYRQAMAEGNDEALMRFVDETAPDLFLPYCAPYTFFKANTGEDGTEFAIAVDMDSLMTDARYNMGVRQLADGEAFTKFPDGVDYIVVVNDHGNVTLFDARTFETLWACV